MSATNIMAGPDVSPFKVSGVRPGEGNTLEVIITSKDSSQLRSPRVKQHALTYIENRGGGRCGYDRTSSVFNVLPDGTVCDSQELMQKAATYKEEDKIWGVMIRVRSADGRPLVLTS